MSTKESGDDLDANLTALFEVTREQVASLSEDARHLDTKLAATIGVIGGLAGLVLSEELPRHWATFLFFLVPFALLSAQGVTEAMKGFKPLRFGFLKVREIYEKHGRSPSSVFKIQLTADLLQISNEILDTLNEKSDSLIRAMRWGFAALVFCIIAKGVALYVVGKN